MIYGYDTMDTTPILLGRPSFLMTTRIKIDVFRGTLSMKVDGETINFNIHSTKRVSTHLIQSMT